MSALFNFGSMCIVIILVIQVATHMQPHFPNILNKSKSGFAGLLGKASVIGNRLSLPVAIISWSLAIWTVFIR